MPPAPVKPAAPTPSLPLAERLLVVGTFLLTAIVFAPLAGWLFVQARASEQLLHAFLVLLLALGFIMVDDRRRWSLSWHFDALSQWLLLSAYLCVGGAFLLQWPVLMLLAFGLAGTAGIRWLFGPARQALALATGAAFTVFLGSALVVPLFDWPLRIFAGDWSGWLLSRLGQNVELRWVEQAGEPMLLLVHDGFPFHVAAECNGFGVLTASLMLATLLVLARPLAWMDRFMYVGLAVLLAGVGNFVRIVIIVLLTEPVGLDHYFLMHEIVGTITYYGTIILLWLLIRSHGAKAGKAAAEVVEIPRPAT